MRKTALALLVVCIASVCFSGFAFLAGFSLGRYTRPLAQPAQPTAAIAIAIEPPHPTPTPTSAPASPSAGKAALASPSAMGADDDLSLIEEAWKIIESEYYSEKPVNYRQAAYGAIRGLIGALGDPHTTFMEPPRHEISKSTYQGKFGGIGAYIALNEAGEPIIARLMPGKPAEAAGLQAGDVIVTVDGKPVAGLSQEEVVLLIRGPVDTTVVLGIRREGQAELLLIPVVRAEIKQPTVRWEPADEGRVAYVELSFFAEPTARELSDALREIRAQGIREIILDLRGNRGGLLSAAGEVAARFLRSDVLLYERRRGADGSTEEVAYMIPRAKDTDEESKVVVLVDGGTASAAEIVAGALQDYQRAVLIGSKTFGKGSMQYVHELADKSSLHVTAAHWLTPKKRPIQGQGLTPDVEVPRSEADVKEGRDPQLESAIAWLREHR